MEITIPTGDANSFNQPIQLIIIICDGSWHIWHVQSSLPLMLGVFLARFKFHRFLM